MTDHVFGKSLNRQFVVYENDIATPVNAISSIALFSSLADAVASTSSIVSTATFSASSTFPYPVSYTLPPVSDPNPSSDRPSWQLWEKISYQISAGADYQPEYRALDFSRAQLGDSVPGTTRADLKILFPALAAYLSDSRIDDILDLAGLQMKLDLKAAKVNYAQARDLHETKLALAYLAIAMSAEGLFVKTGNDAHLERSKMYRKLYGETLGKIDFPYDSDSNGEVDQIKQAQPNFWYVPR